MGGKQLTGVLTMLATGAWLTAIGCNGSSVGSNGASGSVEGEATGGTSGSPTPPVTGSGGQSGVVTGEGTTDGGNSGPGGVPADCHSPPPPTKMNVWTEVPAPIGQTRFVVTDAFAVATDDLLFAGYVPNDADGTGTARIMRWTRGCWTVELELGHTGFRPSPQRSRQGRRQSLGVRGSAVVSSRPRRVDTVRRQLENHGPHQSVRDASRSQSDARARRRTG